MKVLNLHERTLPASWVEAGPLIDSLASSWDMLWPHEKWPPMKLDGPLQVGARSGHGPIRYVVRSYEPGRGVSFTFTGPAGFKGHHRFELEKSESGETVLRHVIEMGAKGAARLTWPLVFRPLHDALIEDALDKAQRSFGQEPPTSSWSYWVKFLRWMFRGGRRRKR